MVGKIIDYITIIIDKSLIIKVLMNRKYQITINLQWVHSIDNRQNALSLISSKNSEKINNGNSFGDANFYVQTFFIWHFHTYNWFR